MTRRKVYLQNAMLLTASGLVLRMLGMGFRVVLSAYLSGEGMGLYQLILAVYMVFVSLATAGMNVAATRLAAQSLARGQGMAATLRGLCTAALAFGTVAMVAQALLAGPAAHSLLHDARAETALRVLAPSLPFMAVSGALRVRKNPAPTQTTSNRAQQDNRIERALRRRAALRRAARRRAAGRRSGLLGVDMENSPLS